MGGAPGTGRSGSLSGLGRVEEPSEHSIVFVIACGVKKDVRVPRKNVFCPISALSGGVQS